MTLEAPVVNQATGLAGTPAGGLAVIGSAGLPQNLTGWTATVDYEFPTTAQMENGNLIYMQIPAGVPAGAAIVQLSSPNGNLVIPAVVMQVDAPDPVIVSAVNASGAPINQSNPAHIGDTVVLTVTGLTQSSVAAGLSNTQVVVEESREGSPPRRPRSLRVRKPTPIRSNLRLAPTYPLVRLKRCRSASVHASPRLFRSSFFRIPNSARKNELRAAC